MPTTTEQLRKALEDMLFSNLVNIFLIKHNDKSIVPGDNTVSFTGDAYDSATDYEVRIIEAIDSAGVSIDGEINIKSRTANGFIIEWTPFAGATTGSVKWTTARYSPKINFWT